MAASNANEIKSIITGLLTSSTGTCTIRQLCDDFLKFEGYRIPYREMGFNNIEEYFRSISDTVIVLGTGPHATVRGVIKPKSAHIVEMVAKQKKPPRRHQRQPISFRLRNRPQSSRYTWVNPRRHFTYEPRSDLSTHPMESSNSITPVGVANWLEFNSKVNKQVEDNSQAIVCGNTTSAPISPPNFSSTSYLTQPARSPTPLEVNLESLPSTSKPLRRSFKDVFETLPKEEENCAGIASPVVNNRPLSPEPELEDFHPHVPKEVRDNLKKLISEFPDGIWCSQLPTEYKKMFKKTLHFERYSYRSLIEMCVDLPGIFNYKKPTPEDFLLCDRTKPFPKIDQALIESTLPEKEIVITTNILNEIPMLNWETIGEKIAPQDVLRLGEKLPPFSFEGRFQVGKYVDVTVGEIYDLSKFWINWENGPLTQIMEDLQIFFGNDHNKYLIPEPLLQEGLYCVAIYLGKYHRALIVNRLPKLDGFVRVFFIDYGTVENVCSNEIWFFPKRFAEFPYQAIRARLADICPPVAGLPWSRKAITRFNQLITNTVLLADVVEVDKEDNVLDIYLADVSDENNIFYINNVLINEGLAARIYDNKERKVAHVDPSWVVDTDCVHMYPDFPQIEAGNAPSLGDMNYIIANNLPMHYCLPQYFDITLNDDIDGIEDCYEQNLEDPEDFPKINLDEIDTSSDYSLFPSAIVDEITEIVRQDESRASGIQQTQTKTEKVPKPEVSKKQNELMTDNPFRGSCNKSRRVRLIEGPTMDGEQGDRSAISSTSTDMSQGETASLCASLNNLSLNNSTPSRPKSTNPFLNDDCLSDVCTNPFLNNSTNPFLSSRDEEIDTKELLEIFSKPSEEKLQENIVNNLNPSPTPPRKLKQVNLERSENFRSSERDAGERPAIRAPPGFNVPRPPPNMIPPPIIPMFNFPANNNPYYRRHPEFHLNNTLFLQNQFGMAMVQQNSASMVPYFMPQFYHHNMQFNMPYNQPFDQNARQRNLHQPFDQNLRPPGPGSFGPLNQKF